MSIYYYLFTPAGSLSLETKSFSKEKCIKKALNIFEGIYKDWSEMENRGYTIEKLDLSW